MQSREGKARENHQDSPASKAGKILGSLPCERFRLHLKVTSLTVLPPYKGGVFRGAFGNAFRRAVCAVPRMECSTCILRSQCLYVSLFEPPAPADFPDAGKFHRAPPPYVLNPPPDNRQAFHPGQTLSFELALMGRAINALPYFTFTFIEMGRRGLGRDRGKYTLEQMELLRNGDTIPIYDGRTETLKALPETEETHPNKAFEETTSLTLRFLTPLRLKEKGRLVTRLDFPLFFDRLCHRIELLTAFYGNNDTLPDPTDLKEKAAEIKTASDELYWYDWHRYSASQKTLMKLGGLRGDISFEGDLGPFLPYLRLGEMVNAGQGTSFGLGRFEIQNRVEKPTVEVGLDE